MVEIYSIAGFSEPVSCWTHLLGAAVFLFLSIELVRQHSLNLQHTIAITIFGFSCVFLLLMSGTYHLLDKSLFASQILQRLDHAAIYVMIAGTITAVHVVLFRGFWRWGIIAIAWLIAIAAIVFKTIYFDNFPEYLGLVSYLIFGWLGAFSGLTLWRKFGFRFVMPLFYGAIAYTIGAVLEYHRQPILIHGVVGPHEIFHVAVLLGIYCHWRFINSAAKVRYGAN